MTSTQVNSIKKLGDEYKMVSLKDELSGEYFLEVSFSTFDDEVGVIRLPATLRSNPSTIAKALAAHNAMLPPKPACDHLIMALVQSIPKEPVVLTIKPGWRGPKGFVMPGRSYHSADGRFRWARDLNDDVPSVGQQRGTLGGWQASVGTLALESPYLSAVMMMQLGAGLSGYVRAHGRAPLYSETALLNIVGETSSGKTTIERAAAGVVGHPSALNDWEISRRGSEETLYRHNHLLALFDDAEKFVGDGDKLAAAAHALTQRVPAGQSRQIATKATENYPTLTWDTFGLSTSTMPLYDLLKLRERRESGDQVRGLDIAIPKAAKGGVFGSKCRAATSGRTSSDLIQQLETAMASNFGVVFPAWIDHLIAEDRSQRIEDLVAKFAARASNVEDAKARRIARKLAVGYAAGKLAVEAGLLPWPADWPFKAMLHCTKRIYKAIQTETLAIDAMVSNLAEWADDREQFAPCKLSNTGTFLIPDSALGIRCTYKGEKVIAVMRPALQDRLYGLALHQFIARLKRGDVLVPGHGGKDTVQLSRPTKHGMGKVGRHRFYLMRLDALNKLA